MGYKMPTWCTSVIWVKLINLAASYIGESVDGDIGKVVADRNLSNFSSKLILGKKTTKKQMGFNLHYCMYLLLTQLFVLKLSINVFQLKTIIL